MFVCACVLLQVVVYENVCERCIHMYICVCACVFVFVCMYVYVYMCVCTCSNACTRLCMYVCGVSLLWHEIDLSYSNNICHMIWMRMDNHSALYSLSDKTRVK